MANPLQRSDLECVGNPASDRSPLEPLRLRELRSLAEAESIREAWRALCLADRSATPFQTWEWNQGLAQYEARRVRPRILVGEDPAGRVVGIAPLCLRRSGLPGFQLLEFIGSHVSDYVDLICQESWRDAFAQRVLEWIDRNREWRILHFKNYAGNSLDRFESDGGFAIRPIETCAFVTLPASLEEYERKILHKKLLANIRRQTRVLSGEGSLQLSASQTTSELRDDLATLFDLHQRRQRSKGERGKFFDARWRESFLATSLALFGDGRVKLGTLRVGGRPIACAYNLRIGDQEHGMMLGMDPEADRLSPGSVIIHWMIGEAIRDGMRNFGFGRGSESYKSRWASEGRPIFEITRARSRFELAAWRKLQTWRDRLMRSERIKQIYLAIFGRRREQIAGRSAGSEAGRALEIAKDGSPGRT